MTHRSHHHPSWSTIWGGVFILLILLTINASLPPQRPLVQNSQATTTVVTTKTQLIQAITAAQPGDIIELQGTIEGGIVITKSGTQNAPIKIIGQQGATIRGGSTGRMVEIRDSQWLFIQTIIFDAAGATSGIYMLNSKYNHFMNNTIKNAGGECFRMKAGSHHNTLLGNTIESCGRTKWNPPSEKTAESVYIGTAPEQLSSNVTEALKSTAADQSGYFADPDNSDYNLVTDNLLRPAYPENTKGNECVDIKEGARNNLIQQNVCSGQLDKNSGGMESRGDFNIFYENTFNAIICGAGVRLGGDDRQTQGVGNFIIRNKFNDYSNTNSICPLSASPGSDPNAVNGAVKVEAPGQNYMCGNTVKNTVIASGSFKSLVNTTEFVGVCDDARVREVFGNKQFGAPAPLLPTPSPSPTPGAGPCPLKSHGDANCKKDPAGGSTADISLLDFNIWRSEFFAGCSQTSLALCQPDNDTDPSSPMDANFNYPGSSHPQPNTAVTIVDYEIWRKGCFTSGIGGCVVASVTNTPVPTISTPPTVPPTIPPSPTSGGCTYPANILNLTNWKITLPIGSGSPTEIFQPQLATYSIDPWFKVLPNCAGVQFRAHTSSPVTTSNSSYPRSELREMINNGQAQAAWSNTSGTHTMIIDQAITAVPTGKKHVVAGQIHDGSNDVIVIRLEYPKLFVDIGGTAGTTLDPAYTLGRRFTVKFVAASGQIHIFYNGSTVPLHTLTKNISNSFFKAGAYTQSNCTRETENNATCSASNYGEVYIYNLQVTHQ